VGALILSFVRTTLFGVAASLLIALPAKAAQSTSVETAVKATYLTKFPSYLDWPPRQLPAGAPIILCVIGTDPFGATLDQAASGGTSGGRTLIVRRYASASDVEKCHIAYLGGSVRDVMAAIASARASPVVTVTDSRNAAAIGMIHFQLIGNSVKFDIDAYKASRAGVGISSKLLGLARKVRRVNST
jgi:hypothetical protein